MNVMISLMFPIQLNCLNVDDSSEMSLLFPTAKALVSLDCHIRVLHNLVQLRERSIHLIYFSGTTLHRRGIVQSVLLIDEYDEF